MTVLLALVATGCGGSDEAGGVCDAPIEEALDPSSGLHFLDPDAEVRYLTDPPTSGPHLTIGAPRTGVSSEPLSPIEQVAQLEAGIVLVQYQPSLGGVGEALTDLGSDQTLIAPNPDLPAPVIATAWTKKISCPTAESLDDVIADLEAFIDTNGRIVVPGGAVPGGHGG
ncbi:MAG: DUF3105 domain-containing protein [Acidimicrobiales bacterium]|nr:DUF3105 domain-containing protein [Acidimicrobiales bacterium]